MLPPLYEQSITGITVRGTLIPSKDCEYKGEHPTFRGLTLRACETRKKATQPQAAARKMYI